MPTHDQAEMSKFFAGSIAPMAPALGGFGAGTTVVENHFHMEGAIISSSADAERWVAQAWNRAASSNRVNINGRRP